VPRSVNPLVVPATTAPSLGLLGARARIDYVGSFELSAFGRNLSNQRHIIAALPVSPLGYANSVRQEPRTYGITRTFRYRRFPLIFDLGRGERPAFFYRGDPLGYKPSQPRENRRAH
jgi:hypothetical protein